ncbi:ferrochelatase [bacterium]|nr:ferrochelatase [bacterium]
MTPGVLIANLGSPDSPSVADVRRYLGQFLMDPYVIDVPWPLRWMIVNLAILPTRPKASAEAYRSVWTEDGSPLVVNTQRFLDKFRAVVPFPVAMAMRYGSPSISTGVDELRRCGVDHIVVVPMYPHYAMSTVRTVVDEVDRYLAKQSDRPTVAVLPPFYNDPSYIEVMAASIRDRLADDTHLLFSYHGLPERHLRKTDCTGRHCMARPDCCDVESPAHATCYRHQVIETTRGIVAALGLDADRWSLAFQSRLGRDPWLQPYTDAVIRELAERGIRRLAVVCPAFVADCLETIEEIGDRAKEDFLHFGGDYFELIPCLNDRSDWVEVMANYVRGLLGAVPGY